MNAPCITRFICPNKPVCSSGRRAGIYYPNGGSYAGYWKCNQHTVWGVKVASKETPAKWQGKKQSDRGTLVYKGAWHEGKRDEVGTMLRDKSDQLNLIYAGQWRNDHKSGEGKKIYDDNTVYFGYWQHNRRHGLGIQWYADGCIYVGEWQADVHHGLGVLFYTNGNRYEGHFARGYKNGEGVFYHMHTGQIQKGMWAYGNAVTSVMQDEMRNQGDQPTPYPIPRSTLQDPNALMCELFQRYMPNASEPPRKFSEKLCLEFTHKMRQFASFEERYRTPTKIDLYTDIRMPYVGKQREKYVSLRSRV